VTLNEKSGDVSDGAYPFESVTTAQTRVIFIRHGESNASVARAIGGYRSCTGLSELGRQQVGRLRDRWIEHPEFEADVLISSNFARARETAEILAPSLGGLPVDVIPGFGEHDPGEECDGLDFEELDARFGPIDWSGGDPYAIGFPGGETVADFDFRVRKTIFETTSRYTGRTIVVACHGGVVAVALRNALKTVPVGGFDMWTINASITELTLVSPGHWRLVRYNDFAHLAGLEMETPRDG